MPRLTPAGLSIRWTMTLLYTGLLAALLVGFSLFLFVSVQSLMIASLTETLHARFAQAEATASQITAALTGRPSTGGGQPLPVLESLAGPDLFLQVRDRAGRVVAASTNLHGQVLPPPLGPLRPRQAQDMLIRLPVKRLLPEAAASDIRTARFEVRSGPLGDARGQRVGTLQVAQSLLAVDEVRERLGEVLARGVAAALVIAVLAGLWLAGRLLRPIAQMTATARRIGSGSDLSHRLAVATRPRRDEVGQLAATFNAMLERLERAFRAQQRFVADAGHELKTPLTAILGQANLIRRWGAAHPELVEEATAAIIEQAERLRRLTQELLDLARLDEGRALRHEAVALGQIAADVVSRLQPLAREKAIGVTVTQGIAPALVRGDRDKLEQLVVNLVDNALKFTPRGGQVRVTTGCVAAGRRPAVVLEVRDSGCGIAAADLPHIFERFYRVDPARSRSAGGTGLGLAIVQEIAHRHGGVAEVESQVGRGSTFRVRLPALDVPAAVPHQ